MTRFAFTLALALSASPGPALSASPPSEFCSDVASLAVGVMTFRQESGVSLRDAITVTQDRVGNGRARELLTMLFIDAYDWPRAMTPRGRTETITDFGNTWLRACYETMEDPRD